MNPPRTILSPAPRILAVLALVALLISTATADESLARQPWTESRVRGTPDPPKPYVPEPVFESLNINQGLEMVAHDGRIVVVERGGKIWSFPEESEPDIGADLFIDLKALHPNLESAYGIAFHPGGRKKREVFLSYTVRPDVEDGTRLSRFGFDQTETGALRVMPETEEVILTWRRGGHNGANLRFGPDGMLYVSTGDATPPHPPDSLNTGQDNADLLACILRIDIDHAGDGKPYRVPSDNPFVGHDGVRPEIWAFGFRNPWKMSFGRNGRLWVGDVGWELWEMIHVVEKGGNYGWSAMEASHPVRPETASVLSPISPPMAAHPHSEAASITGGFEYEGSRLPELRGAYVYGDYETGLIWALRLGGDDGRQVLEHRVIADTPHKISTFGRGNEGELYYAHYTSPTTFYRLAPNPRVGQSPDFPRKLSETGLFANVAKQVTRAGVYEFAIHEAMWQDGAEATRYIGLPNDREVHTEIVYQPNGNRRITTTWPEDAVLAKTIRLGQKPVETQLLHFDGNAWNGYSYRWNDAGTDARLADAVGEEFEVPTASWKGGPNYRIPSRAECMRCHNMWNQFTPAFEPMQLAGFAQFPQRDPREVAGGLGLTNSDFFHKNSSGQLVNSRRGGSLEKRARSWLHANCAHCHRRHGGGSAPLEVNFERTLSESATIWQMPTRGDFGLEEARIIVPGQPWRSILNYRVSTIGNGHMPPLGSREVDEHGAQTLWEWIRKLPHGTEVVAPAPGHAGTSPALHLSQGIASGEGVEGERAGAIEAGLASPNENIRALFERFRPPQERPAPRELDPSRILRLGGDAENGAALLSTTGRLASCFACHRIGEEGGVLGPDLAQVGDRLNRQQLLESLVQPSKIVAPEYRVWIVETHSGETHPGFQTERTDTSLTLALVTGQTQTIPLAQIRSSKPQPTSLMPPGLLNLLTEQEAADLLAYLETLRSISVP